MNSILRFGRPLRVVLGCQRRTCVLTLGIHEFQPHLGNSSVTASAFSGLPLATLSPKVRGELLANVVRGALEDVAREDQFADAIPGMCVNGTRNGWNRCAYDWKCNGRKVECKSGQLLWMRGRQRWKLTFCGIQPGNFDDLVLVSYTPRGIHVYQKDDVLNVPPRIQFYSRGYDSFRDATDTIEDATDTILAKLGKQANFLLHLPFTHWRIRSAVMTSSMRIMEQVYCKVPLGRMTPSSRGLLMQKIMRAVDQLLHPLESISDPLSGSCTDGRRRGTYRAEYDWIRGSVRVECKHTQLTWDRSRSRWKASFNNIKFAFACVRTSALFDELQLALYTPRGIYIYRHDFQFGVSTTGVSTISTGHAVQVTGPSNQEDWQVALCDILCKFEESNCERLAFISW